MKPKSVKFKFKGNWIDVNIFNVGESEFADKSLDIICNQKGYEYIESLEYKLKVLAMDHPIINMETECGAIKGDCGSLEKAYDEIMLQRNVLENVVDTLSEMVKHEEKSIKEINDIIKESGLFNE